MYKYILLIFGVILTLISCSCGESLGIDPTNSELIEKKVQLAVEEQMKGSTKGKILRMELRNKGNLSKKITHIDLDAYLPEEDLWHGISIKTWALEKYMPSKYGSSSTDFKGMYEDYNKKRDGVLWADIDLSDIGKHISDAIEMLKASGIEDSKGNICFNRYIIDCTGGREKRQIIFELSQKDDQYGAYIWIYYRVFNVSNNGKIEYGDPIVNEFLF